MAFDLLSGNNDGTSWARGDVVVDATVARVKKWPWLKIFIGAGAALGAIALLSNQNKSKREIRSLDPKYREENEWMESTQQIPRETMHQLVHGKAH